MHHQKKPGEGCFLVAEFWQSKGHSLCMYYYEWNAAVLYVLSAGLEPRQEMRKSLKKTSYRVKKENWSDIVWFSMTQPQQNFLGAKWVQRNTLNYHESAESASWVLNKCEDQIGTHGLESWPSQHKKVCSVHLQCLFFQAFFPIMWLYFGATKAHT